MRRLYEECLEGVESVWQCVAIVWRVCVWRVCEESVESVCGECVWRKFGEACGEVCLAAWEISRKAVVRFQEGSGVVGG